MTLEGLYGFIPSPNNFDTYAYAVRVVHRYHTEDATTAEFCFSPARSDKENIGKHNTTCKGYRECTNDQTPRFPFQVAISIQTTRDSVHRYYIFQLSRHKRTYLRPSILRYQVTHDERPRYEIEIRNAVDLPGFYACAKKGYHLVFTATALLNRKAKKSKSLNREYLVKESYSEPYHPWQNPVETQCIKWLKKTSHLMMDHVGSPDFVWLDAMIYVALVNNWTADKLLGWITPFEKRHGSTPDISALLCFHFFEKIFYLDFDEKFPSSKEKTGYILGVAMNVGDALTFKILTDDHETTIHRSVVRSAKAHGHQSITASCSMQIWILLFAKTAPTQI
jgi:hypothetical protein